jgi:hypothetical protein
MGTKNYKTSAKPLRVFWNQAKPRQAINKDKA